MRGFGSIGLKGYRPLKAAQMAAYFVDKDGGNIEKLKLIKLMYLTERESMRQRARPMFYDEMYSLPHGPILSNALKGINGETDVSTWTKLIELHGARNVKRAKRKHAEKFDQFSESDLKIMESVWKEFGRMSATQIRNWTHKHCPEYTEVEKGALPIRYKDVFAAVGHENADELSDAISEYRLLEVALEH